MRLVQVEQLKKYRKVILALSLWILILIIIRTAMAVNNLSLNELGDVFVAILRDTQWGLLLFIGLYILRPLLLMPGTIMNFIAGMVYGFPFGFGMVVIAHLISASTTYGISRWTTHNEPQLDGRIGKIASFLQENPFEAMVTLQLSYISLDITSSLAGILHLPYHLFILGIFVGAFVGNGIGVLIGTSIEGSIANGTITIRPEMILLSLTVFLISIGISTYLRRRNQAVFGTSIKG